MRTSKIHPTGSPNGNQISAYLFGRPRSVWVSALNKPARQAAST
jgi:hypothetical protein